MKSVLSFPDRGPWGNAKWRGNCSGKVIQELIGHFRPSLFVDVCEGSGTSRDVCRELGVEYRGFDLHGTPDMPDGTDFTAEYVLSQLPRPADVVFSHPPYHSIIDYRSIGIFADPSKRGNDTSACSSVDEFLEKSQVMLLNQREATREGGVFATLIGDMRKEGQFRSFQADFIGMIGQDELISVTVKLQHNCHATGQQRYRETGHIPIVHEYLLLWKKSNRTLVNLSLHRAIESKTRTDFTWKSLLRIIMMRNGGRATLKEIYAEVEREAPEMIRRHPHWNSKVRQTLQRHFQPVKRGVWANSAA